MKNLCISFFVIIFLMAGFSGGNIFKQEQNLFELLDTNLPGLTPKVFAPGIVSTQNHEWGITFAPDSKTFFFTTLDRRVRGQGRERTIVSISFHNGQWGKPEVAPFSGKYSDSSPVMNLKGTRLFFTSFRPTHPGDNNLESNIWYIERTKNGLGEPVPLSSDINLPDKHEFYPAVAPNGDLYFVANRSDSRGRDDIYVARWKNGQFDYPENLGDNINTEYVDSCPYISPDGTYLIFEIVDKPGGLGGGDMYISYKQKDGKWGPAKHLGKEFNSPKHDFYPALTPDQKYFFFVSTRNGNFDIYWVETKLLNKYLPGK